MMSKCHFLAESSNLDLNLNKSINLKLIGSNNDASNGRLNADGMQYDSYCMSFAYIPQAEGD